MLSALVGHVSRGTGIGKGQLAKAAGLPSYKIGKIIRDLRDLKHPIESSQKHGYWIADGAPAKEKPVAVGDKPGVRVPIQPVPQGDRSAFLVLVSGPGLTVERRVKEHEAWAIVADLAAAKVASAPQ